MQVGALILCLVASAYETSMALVTFSFGSVFGMVMVRIVVRQELGIPVVQVARMKDTLDLWSSLLTLGRVQASLALLSLNRSLIFSLNEVGENGLQPSFRLSISIIGNGGYL